MNENPVLVAIAAVDKKDRSAQGPAKPCNQPEERPMPASRKIIKFEVKKLR